MRDQFPNNLLIRILSVQPNRSIFLNVMKVSFPVIALSVLFVMVQIYFVITFFPWTYPDRFYYLFITSPIIAAITAAMLAIPLVWLNMEVVHQVQRQQKLVEQASDQLEKNIEQRTRFIGYVSHEIRNPLNGIIGITDSLDASDLDEEYKSKFKLLKDASLDLGAILNDILDLSKIDSGALNMNPMPTNLIHVISDLQDFWMPRAESKGLTMRLKVSEKFPPWIYIDPSRFRQVANNLLSNALKYTDKGYVEVTLDCDKDLKTAVYSVLDSGPGIPNNLREAIFDPYYQVPNVLDVPQKIGTGLGLPIARQLAEQMGGDVWIRSTVMKGSHFSFSFDINEVAPSDIPEEVIPSLNMDFTGKTVLVVDDVQTNLLVASEMLKKLGFEVETAINGAQAITILDKRQFDCVLLDDDLGDMRGHQVLEQVKQIQEKTRFISYTGNILDSHKQRSYKLGMHGFIAKPVRMSTLKNELDRVFG